MRSIDEVRTVLALARDGFNDCQIARQTGVPRRTVQMWRSGQVPRRQGRDPGCPRCGRPAHDFARLPPWQYSYVLGLYLGDGYVSAGARRVFRLRITLDTRYPGIINECAHAVAEILPNNKVSIIRREGENAADVSAWSRCMPCYFPQHGAGKKHHRPIRIEDWQGRLIRQEPKALLRGLIHSDGCRSTNTIRHPMKTYSYPRYLFSNHSDDIREIFCAACSEVGVEWRQMNAVTISIAKRDSVRLMDGFIGPKR